MVYIWIARIKDIWIQIENIDSWIVWIEDMG